MKAPLYRVGQHVDAIPNEIPHDQNSPYARCFILQAHEDGNYFVRVEKTGGYAIVSERDIVSAPEMDLLGHPYDRKGIRIVFFGNGQFALPALKYLVKSEYDVCCAVTMPDKPQGRGKRLKPSAVKEYAISQGIPVFQPLKLDAYYFRMQLEHLNPTIGVVVEFRILPICTFGIPKWGTINLHSSLLPQYRGASTIASAIQNGDTMTGVTTFLINRSVDTGHIINNLAVPILETDTAKDVHDRLKTVGAVMVDDAIQRIAHGCSYIPQEDLICDFITPSYAPKIRKNGCAIPWWKPTRFVYDFIRSLSPTPGAWTTLKWLGAESADNIKIYKTCITDMAKGEHSPGELFIKDGKIYIACSDGVLSIDELQMPNKKRMTTQEFICGYRGIGKGFCISLPKDGSIQADPYVTYADNILRTTDKNQEART